MAAGSCPSPAACPLAAILTATAPIPPPTTCIQQRVKTQSPAPLAHLGKAEVGGTCVQAGGGRFGWVLQGTATMLHAVLARLDLEVGLPWLESVRKQPGLPGQRPPGAAARARARGLNRWGSNWHWRLAGGAPTHPRFQPHQPIEAPHRAARPSCCGPCRWGPVHVHYGELKAGSDLARVAAGREVPLR